MASGTRKVIVDGTEYSVSSALSQAEIKRTISTLTGQPWLLSAQVCEDPDGTIRLNRPPAAPKG